MKSNQAIIRLPKLYDANGDISKKWYIHYQYRNPKSGKWERFKEAKGLSGDTPANIRYQKAAEIISDITIKLKNGFSPFNNPDLIYPDNIQYQTSIKHYKNAVAQNGTFKFFASKFLDSISHNHEDSTISSYRSKLRMFNAWLENKKLDTADITSLNNQILNDFFMFIIKSRNLSKNSVKKYNQILFNTFKFACKENLGMQNPVIEMPSTKTLNENAPLPIRTNHIKTITDALQNKDPQLLLASKFLFYCCIRPGNELRFLRIGDIDFIRGTIDVAASRAKTKLFRKVTIPEHFLLELQAMQIDTLPHAYYIISHNGKPGPAHLGKNTLRLRWSKISRELNLPNLYKFYSWKHTGNVAAADAGIPIYFIQNQNGHKSIRSTEIYLRNKAGSLNNEIRNLWPQF